MTSKPTRKPLKMFLMKLGNQKSKFRTMKVEITEAQLNAIVDMALDVEAMMGCANVDENGDNWDVEMEKRLKMFKRFLVKNGYENPFNSIGKTPKK